MIFYESDEYQGMIMSSEIPVACPITVKKHADGFLDITTIRWTKYIAEEIEAKFADDPFTPEALDRFHLSASSFLATCGYGYDRESSTPIAEYTLDSADLLPEIIPEDAVLIMRPALDGDDPDILADHECILPFDPDESECAAVIVDDRIVCLAQINDYSDSEGTEITVECAPEYRGRGYAKAACAELCRFLIENGETVTYKTYISNKASTALAESLGFTRTAVSLTAVGIHDGT